MHHCSFKYFIIVSSFGARIGLRHMRGIQKNLYVMIYRIIQHFTRFKKIIKWLKIVSVGVALLMYGLGGLPECIVNVESLAQPDLVSHSQTATFLLCGGGKSRVWYNDNGNPVQAFTSFKWALIGEATNFITLLTSSVRTIYIRDGKKEDTNLKRIAFHFKLALKNRQLS